MKKDEQGVIIVPWWLRSETLVVGLLAVITFLVGIGQFWQHTSDFEIQSKESFRRIEQRLDTFALRSELQRLEDRVKELETHERDKSTSLTRLNTQMERLHEDIQSLEQIRDMLGRLVQQTQGSVSIYDTQ